MEAVNETDRYFALPYGPSGVAPRNNPREFELYFERLTAAGLGTVKRPDLLVFIKRDRELVLESVKEIGGETELPFTQEEHPNIQALLASAVIAVECENSLWKATRMRDYGTPLTPQRRMGGREGLKKSAIVPTVIIKDEDRAALEAWQQRNPVKLHIWHVFYDLAFGLQFEQAERLIESGMIEPTNQTFQAPGGAVTRKTIYKIYYQHAYELGVSSETPTLQADYIEDKNGHIIPYVRFQGGRLRLSTEVIKILDQASIARK